MIELAAATLREELEQMSKRAVNASKKSFTPTNAEERVNGKRVLCEVRWRNVRGELRPVRQWFLDGRPYGFNALMGVLRRAGAA